MSEYYDNKYRSSNRFWGDEPTSIARKVASIAPPSSSPRLLEIGCGEGRDVVFFAQNGYRLTAFDLSYEGVRKTRKWAEELGLIVDVFQADINLYRLREPFDIVFSSGTLQYIPSAMREEIVANYRDFTNLQGIHAFTIPVHMPLIEAESDPDTLEHTWYPGEILTFYQDWKIEFFQEEILDNPSGGQFAVNRLVARNTSA